MFSRVKYYVVDCNEARKGFSSADDAVERALLLGTEVRNNRGRALAGFFHV